MAVISAGVLTATLTAAVLLDEAGHRGATRDNSAASMSSTSRTSGNDVSRSAPRLVPAPAPQPTSQKQVQPTPTPQKTSTKQAAPAKPVVKRTVSTPVAKELGYQYQAQTTYYYCGPAATRIALTARGHYLSQDDIASRLGTTVDGTNSADDTTRVLNNINRTNFYRSRWIPGSAATPAQATQLQTDVVHAIVSGYPVVANIVGTATDTAGGSHSFSGGHYLTVVGYRDRGRHVKIADPADANGSYWMTAVGLAHWVAQRGYSA
jgi:hypothetical protein